MTINELIEKVRCKLRAEKWNGTPIQGKKILSETVNPVLCNKIFLKYILKGELKKCTESVAGARKI